MRVPRVVVPGASGGVTLPLSGDQARHLARVLRRGTGDPVEIVDGSGGRWEGAIAEVREGPEGPDVLVRVGEPARDGPRIVPWTVGVGLVKTADMDVCVRLASELGLERLVPLDCRRSQVRAEKSSRPRRWEKIALESARQCGRARALEIGAVTTPGKLAREGEGGPVWLATPPGAGGGGEGSGAWPGGGPGCPGAAARPATFLVGPEGGLSLEEREEAVEAGALPLTFPVPVLRTPTAVLLIAALAVVARGLEDPSPSPDFEKG